MIPQYPTFINPGQARDRMRQAIYEIGTAVSDFFWDDAPVKYGLETREEQQDMAYEVLDAIRNGQHLAVEAGTGVGKSYAYLVPLLLYNQRTHLPVAIATSTIALQEQLMEDVERLKPMLGVDPTVLLAKGQSHYLCLRRADAYFHSPQGQVAARLKAQIDDGCQDRRSFPYQIPSAVWDQINVVRFGRRSCRNCPFRDDCQYDQLRVDLRYTSGVIICNQDFLTAHLLHRSRDLEGLMSSSVQLAVVDEAHNLEDKVRSATTERFGQRQLIGIIRASILSFHDAELEVLQVQAGQAEDAVRALYHTLNGQMQQQITSSERDLRYAERFFFRDTPEAIRQIRAVARELAGLSGSVQIYSTRNRLRTDADIASDELEAASKSFAALVQNLDNRLLWLERRGNAADLVSCPKNTRDIISRLYFRGGIQSILTSATLTSGSDGDLEHLYSYFVNNTGFPAGGQGVLAEPKPSPFPYDQHGLIYYCEDLPHPTREHEAFIQQGVQRLLQVLRISHGRALVLFTSKADMEEVYAALREEELPYQVLIQEQGASQERVLQAFREDIDSVLLGTGAYWEGISIEGKSLSHVVIFRLPFPTPDPIIEYKASIAADPLMEVRVPEMVIKLRQGIGRLIRNFTDTGLISIIDSRLRDNPPARYHDVVWNALPIHHRTVSLQEAEDFYRRVCER